MQESNKGKAALLTPHEKAIKITKLLDEKGLIQQHPHLAKRIARIRRTIDLLVG
jgi:hypothetical protein